MSTSRPDPPTSDGRPPGERAIAVETYVRERDGQWSVDIVVVFPDGGVNRTVNTYRTRRHAEIAAGWIRRAADRDIEGPVDG